MKIVIELIAQAEEKQDQPVPAPRASPHPESPVLKKPKKARSLGRHLRTDKGQKRVRECS